MLFLLSLAGLSEKEHMIYLAGPAEPIRVARPEAVGLWGTNDNFSEPSLLTVHADQICICVNVFEKKQSFMFPLCLRDSVVHQLKSVPGRTTSNADLLGVLVKRNLLG